MNKAEKEVLQFQLDQEKQTIKEITKIYEEAKREVESKIKMLSARTDMENLQSIIYQKQYQQALKDQIDAVLEQLHSNNFETVSEYLTACYQNAFIGTMYDISYQGIPIIAPIAQDQVIKAINVDSKLSITLYKAMGEDINKLKKNIRAELSRGVAQGKSYNDIAAYISLGMNSPYQKSLNRTLVIARTEGHRIQNQADLDAQDAAKKKGADVVKQWDAFLDGNTRDSHRQLDGQIRELDEMFSVDGKKASAPGMFGDPAEDINCRCAMLTRARWALDDAELQTLKERAAYFKLDKTDNFSDFKKKYLKASGN